MTKKDILDKLIAEVNTLPYRDKVKLEVFKDKAELTFKGFEGNNGEYRYLLNRTRFAPWSFYASDEDYQRAWNSGIEALLSILNRAIADPQLVFGDEVPPPLLEATPIEAEIKPKISLDVAQAEVASDKEEAPPIIVPALESQSAADQPVVEEEVNPPEVLQEPPPVVEEAPVVKIDERPQDISPEPLAVTEEAPVVQHEEKQPEEILQEITPVAEEIPVVLEQPPSGSEPVDETVSPEAHALEEPAVSIESPPPAESFDVGSEIPLVPETSESAPESTPSETQTQPEVDYPQTDLKKFIAEEIEREGPKPEKRSRETKLSFWGKIPNPFKRKKEKIEEPPQKLAEETVPLPIEEPQLIVEPETASSFETSAPAETPVTTETAPESASVGAEEIAQPSVPVENPEVPVSAEVTGETLPETPVSAETKEGPKETPQPETILPAPEKSLNQPDVDNTAGLSEVPKKKTPKILLVTGNDERMQTKVTKFLTSLGFEIILTRGEGNVVKPMIQKLAEFKDAEFAIVLLSFDGHYYVKDKKAKDAKFLSQPGVIFEMGYLIGKLGRNKVFVLYNEKQNFEMPTLFFDAYYITYNPEGHWDKELKQTLKDQGALPT